MSQVRKISLSFAQQNPALVGILFVLQIDPIRGISYFSDEDEVLFSRHSVFRIHDIKPMDENDRVYEVSLTLTSDNDKKLNALTQRIRKENFPNAEGWYRLSLVLTDMGQNNKAEEIYEMLLIETTKESDIAAIYNHLGLIKYNQGEYEEAIKYL
ncbi:hypothetical protein I4U23_022221 [Adineta vaga]|nr:hypothetical protein I4U23_022221 [Adineta vaga]